MARAVDGSVIDDVERKIKREQVLIQGAKDMRRSTQNPSVRQQCDNYIRETEKNIVYLEEKLKTLTVRNGAGTGDAENGGEDVPRQSPPNITRLDVLRYDNPYMGPRIQLMLQQLDFKLSVEKQYKAGIEKLQSLYQQDGDRRSRADAADNLTESNAKIALLRRSLKRYADLHLNIDNDELDDEQILPNNRRPLSGILRVNIKRVESVDHTAASTWTLTPSSFVVIKVDNQAVGQTNESRTLEFGNDFTIPVDKGSEIEFLVYDQAGSSKTPIAVMWVRVSDIVEAIRRKRATVHAASGWANAATVQRHQSMLPSERDRLPSLTSSSTTASTVGSRPSGTAKTGPPIMKPGRDASSFTPPVSASSDPNTVDGWFILEPAGRIQMSLSFEKTSNGIKRSYGGFENLGRHNAIRKHEDTQDIHGHQFAHPQFYNIMVCAICGEFMTYPYQCMECKFACHRKCMAKVVTHCAAQITADVDNDDQLNHRIPHRLEPASNMSANWCCHCGGILPLGKKNVRKCTECGVVCHAGCAKYVPEFCGMTMEMAFQIVSEIKSTRIRQVTKAAARDNVASKPQHGRVPKALGAPSAVPGQVHKQPYASGVPTQNLAPRHVSSRTEPIKRKQVGSTPYDSPSHTHVDAGKQFASGDSMHGLDNSERQLDHKIDRVSMGANIDDFNVDSFVPSWAEMNKNSAVKNMQPAKTTQQTDRNADYEGVQGSQGTDNAWWSRQDYEKSSEYDDTLYDRTTPYGADNDHDQSQDKVTEMLDAESIDEYSLDPVQQDTAAEREVLAEEAAEEEVRPEAERHSEAQIQARAAQMIEQAKGSLAPSHTDKLQTHRLSLSPSGNSSAAAAAAAAAALAGAASVPATRPQSQYGTQSSTAVVAPDASRKKKRKKVGLEDFSFLAVLGKGNFGKVMLAESKHTNKLYAIKVLKKNFIIENREVESTRSEKSVFFIANRDNCPFLINLSACFQTENRIYFVMDFVSGGDLMYHIQKELFTPRQAQFYAAEVLLALKHFHDNDVIYRDLKLDNILLTLDGHIKVADYGLCKEDMGYGKTTGTFCGTPDFIAPEILLDQKYGRSVDWWAFGVLMYQMLLGKSPFRGKDEDEVYDAILSDEPLYPIHMPRDSVSILQKLLTRDPARRLGSGPRDALEIMEHPYFRNINFDDLLHQRVEAPYKPHIDTPTDVRFFDKEFTSETPALTPMNSVLDQASQDQFRGFSYTKGDQI